MRILIVDDESDTRTMIRQLLESEGMEASEAEDAMAAGYVLRKDRFDAVLLDLQMPGVSWMDAVKFVRSVAPQTPVIVISAHADWDVFFDASALGTKDVLMKPFRAEDLLRVVRNAASGKAEGESSPERMVS